MGVTCIPASGLVLPTVIVASHNALNVNCYGAKFIVQIAPSF